MDRVGGVLFTNCILTGSAGFAAAYTHPWLGSLSPWETLRAKPLREDRRWRSSSRGGFRWKGFPCPRHSRAAAASARFLG